MPGPSEEILHDFSPLMRVYKDGRVERLIDEDIVPAGSINPDTGVRTKDVEFSPEQNLSARLYLPKNATPGHKLPVLVYYHGGGFLVQSAFSRLYQNPLQLLAEEANVIIVSVNYRLAPEYPLPIAYEDSWLALRWLASHSKSGNSNEVWLKEYADLDHVYLGGDSSGGNIAHNMAMRAGLEKLDGVHVNGIFLNCPHFGGKEPVGDEAAAKAEQKAYIDRVWLFVYPTTCGLDDPSFNPAMDPRLPGLGCKRVLIFVGGEDVLKHRGWYYKDVLGKSGWIGDVEVLEFEGEGHVFNLFAPTCDNAISMVKKLASFLNCCHKP